MTYKGDFEGEGNVFDVFFFCCPWISKVTDRISHFRNYCIYKYYYALLCVIFYSVTNFTSLTFYIPTLPLKITTCSCSHQQRPDPHWNRLLDTILCIKQVSTSDLMRNRNTQLFLFLQVCSPISLHTLISQYFGHFLLFI